KAVGQMTRSSVPGDTMPSVRKFVVRQVISVGLGPVDGGSALVVLQEPEQDEREVPELLANPLASGPVGRNVSGGLLGTHESEWWGLHVHVGIVVPEWSDGEGDVKRIRVLAKEPGPGIFEVAEILRWLVAGWRTVEPMGVSGVIGEAETVRV